MNDAGPAQPSAVERLAELSPARQMLVPGLFVWALTVLRPAWTTRSTPALTAAGVALLALLAGPLLERWLRERARALAFWTFVLAAAASLGVAPALRWQRESLEALVALVAWALFGFTVAAPAIARDERGALGVRDPSLVSRSEQRVRTWPWFAVGGLVSSASLVLALREVERERATAFVLVSTLASLLLWSTVGARCKVSRGQLTLGATGLLWLLVALACFVAAVWLLLRG